MALARLFAEAPFVEDGWNAALAALASASGSSHGQLLALGERHLRFNWLTDEPEGYVDDFRAIGADRPDVNWRIAASGGLFEIIHEHHYDTVRAQHENEAYRAHIERYGGINGCQTALINEPGAFFGLAVLRSQRDGRSDHEHLARFARAAPHVLAAIRLQHALEHRAAALLSGSLEAMGTAAFLFDAAGRLVGRTPATESLLRSGALRVRGQQLSARTREDDLRLQARLADTFARPADPARRQLWIDRDEDGRMFLEIFPLPRQPWGMGVAPAVLLTVRAPRRPDPGDAAMLAAVFGLTEAESMVAAMMAAGVSRATIAAARGTSPQTLASQLKAIYRKCDAAREAELVVKLGAVLGTGRG